MGVCIYPRIENVEADWVYKISGKALSKNLEKLSKIVRKQGLKDLMDYYVPTQTDLDDWKVEEKVAAAWFEPAEGVALVDAMMLVLKEHRDQFEHTDHLETDLVAFRAILGRAASEGLRWNLGVSY